MEDPRTEWTRIRDEVGARGCAQFYTAHSYDEFLKLLLVSGLETPIDSRWGGNITSRNPEVQRELFFKSPRQAGKISSLCCGPSFCGKELPEIPRWAQSHSFEMFEFTGFDGDEQFDDPKRWNDIFREVGKPGTLALERIDVDGFFLTKLVKIKFRVVSRDVVATTMLKLRLQPTHWQFLGKW